MLSYSFGPHLERHPQGANSPASASSQKSNLLGWRLVFNSLDFLSILHKALCVSSAWGTRTLSPVSSRTIVTSLSDTSIRPRAPTLTPASMLHLTNPCAKLKGMNRNPSAGLGLGLGLRYISAVPETLVNQFVPIGLVSRQELTFMTGGCLLTMTPWAQGAVPPGLCIRAGISFLLGAWRAPKDSPVDWGYRIHRLHLCRGVRSSSTSVIDVTLNTVMSHFGNFRNVEYPFIALLPAPLLSGVVAPDRVLSMGQIEQTNVSKQMTDVKLSNQLFSA